MKLFTIYTCGLLFCISFFASAQQIDYKGFPQWSWGKQDSTEYYLYTPSNMKAGEKYPIALFLHGCCGTDYKATLRNAVDPPARMWHNFGENKQTVPTYIIAPKTSRGWKQHMVNLKKVMDDLVANHQGDPQRIYITGFSMGGAGTWDFIQAYPDYFAAALPMGMDFRGDPEKVKHIPIWANKGETDWYARRLNKAVADIRRQNADLSDADTSANWIMGVNPRFTEFKGVGHGVQWIAASSQDLTGWAYSKVNDGNVYPVVYLKSPGYKQVTEQDESITVEVVANDPDGEIRHVQLLLNGKSIKKMTRAPYGSTFKISAGDSKLEAIATDNGGKTSVASTIVKTNIPVKFKPSKLPRGVQGNLYKEYVMAEGNGDLQFALAEGSVLPDGLVLRPDGMVNGIPVTDGNYNLIIRANDEDGDSASAVFHLDIQPKNINTVVVTDVRNYAGKAFPVSIVRKGELPHNDRPEDEVTLSETSNFEGLVLIQTDANDTITAAPHYMEFTVDEDVVVYVAYEKLDHLFQSTIPEWLKEFKKVDAPQMVAQYFYYDVYSKPFSKGTIRLPDASEKANGVNTNYFVMIKKKPAGSDISHK